MREARQAGYKPARVAITIAVKMLWATSTGVRSSLSSNLAEQIIEQRDSAEGQDAGHHAR